MSMNIKQKHIIYTILAGMAFYIFNEMWTENGVLPLYGGIVAIWFIVKQKMVDADEVDEVTPANIGPSSASVSPITEYGIGKDGIPHPRHIPPDYDSGVKK
jgi:hypothetical protein